MWEFLFSAKGRISRADIWFRFLLPLVALFGLATFLNAALIGEDAGPAWIVLILFYLWPSIVVLMKRFHDRGMSGWWVLYSFLLILLGDAMAVATIFRVAYSAITGRICRLGISTPPIHCSSRRRC